MIILSINHIAILLINFKTNYFLKKIFNLIFFLENICFCIYDKLLKKIVNKNFGILLDKVVGLI